MASLTAKSSGEAKGYTRSHLGNLLSHGSELQAEVIGAAEMVVSGYIRRP